MGRRGRNDSLVAWMNGERVGEWSIDSRGQQQFAYADAWLASKRARAISLSIPLRPASEPYRDAVVSAFFDNLLPENATVRRRLAGHFGVSDDAFALLREIGRDCVGALQLLPEGDRPDVEAITGEGLSEEQVGGLLRAIRGHQPLDRELEEFRISLAGNQDKIALLRRGRRWLRPTGATPSTHILKPPIGPTQFVDLSTSVANEWLCAKIARAAGFDVAACDIAVFDDQVALVVERFDRRLSADDRWIVRLPQEDFCQATGTPAALKYEPSGGPGVRPIMQLLRGADDPNADRRTFMKVQAFFWLLCATDGHAKNFSLFLEAGGGFRLTPLYDILSVYPVLGTKRGQLSPHKVKMAMAVWGKARHYHWKKIRPDHFVTTAQSLGVNEAAAMFAEVFSATAAACDRVEAELPRGVDAAVADPILDGVRAKAKEALKAL